MLFSLLLLLVLLPLLLWLLLFVPGYSNFFGAPGHFVYSQLGMETGGIKIKIQIYYFNFLRPLLFRFAPLEWPKLVSEVIDFMRVIMAGVPYQPPRFSFPLGTSLTIFGQAHYWRASPLWAMGQNPDPWRFSVFHERTKQPHRRVTKLIKSSSRCMNLRHACPSERENAMCLRVLKVSIILLCASSLWFFGGNMYLNFL